MSVESPVADLHRLLAEVRSLNTAAMANPVPSEALLLLNDAASLVDLAPPLLKAVVADSETHNPVAVKFLEVEVLRAGALTTTHLRDVATQAGNFPLALVHAERAVAADTLVAQELAALEAMHAEAVARATVDDLSAWPEAGSPSPGLTESQVMALRLERQRLGPVHFAKATMTLCVLLGKNKKHHDAAKKAHRAVLLLKTTLSAAALQQDDEPTTSTAAVAEARQLLVGAIFNLATQLELCGRNSEAAMHFADAAELAGWFLGPSHPLTKQLAKITARGSVPNTVPARSETASVVTAASSKRGGSAGRGSVSAAAASAPPTTLPHLAGAGAAAARAPIIPATAVARPPQTAPTAPARSRHHQGALPPLPLSSVAAVLDPVEFTGAGPFPLSGRSDAAAPKVAWGTPRPEVKELPLAANVAAIDLTAAVAARQPPPRPLDSRNLLQPAAAGQSKSVSPTPSSSRANGASTSSARAHSTSRRGQHTVAAQEDADLVARTTQQQTLFFAWMSGITDQLYNDYARRDRSAAAIQRAWRSAQARLEAHNRRQTFYYFLHHEQKCAVECIAAWFRRFSQRRRLLARVAAARAQQVTRCAAEQRQHAACLVITKNMRIYTRRRNFERQLMRQLQLVQEEKLQQYETAAIVIQRWWPIIKAERAYWRRRNAEIAEQKRLEELRQRHDRAATNIARVWRGWLGRQYAKQFRLQQLERKRQLQARIAECIDVVRIVLKEYRARKNRLEREALRSEVQRSDAAVRIQQSWATCLRRRATHLVHQRAQQLNRCAAIVQRCYKRYRARRDLRVLRTIHRTSNQHRVVTEMRQHRAAIAIQCAARVMFARRAKRRAMASRGRRLLLAAWLLQRVGRGASARVSVRQDQLLREHLIAEAIALALAERCAKVALVQAALRHRASCVLRRDKLWAIEAEELLIRRRAMREMRHDRAATQIQRVVRGCRGRVRAAAVRAEVAAAVQRVLAAVVKLQCFFRVALAKSRMSQRRVERMRLADKKRLYEEVQSELFAERAAELELLAADSRRRIADTERTEFWSIFCAQTNDGGTKSLPAAIAASSLAAAVAAVATARSSPRQQQPVYSALNDDDGDYDDGDDADGIYDE